MKKVTVIILLTYSICGFAIKWEKIAEDYDGNPIYIDLDSIEKKESRVYYSNLIDFLKTKQKSYSVVSKFKVDCGEEQMSWLSTTFYSQPMGKGKLPQNLPLNKFDFHKQMQLLVRNYYSFVDDLNYLVRILTLTSVHS